MHATPIGSLLRDWRQRRRQSQLDLALAAEVSTRHLSFLETGRARPSREMVLHLAEHLAVPLRARNALLRAAGFAPVFAERPLDDPELADARQAVERVLTGHEPSPALAVDRHWNLLAANRMIGPFLDGVAPHLLEAPVNVLRLTLHPDGLAPRILDFAELRGHLLRRLRQQTEATADSALEALLEELSDYPAPEGEDFDPGARASVVLPFALTTAGGVLRFYTTTTVFGMPMDITLAELAIESFFPADAETAARLRAIAESLSSP